MAATQEFDNLLRQFFFVVVSQRGGDRGIFLVVVMIIIFRQGICIIRGAGYGRRCFGFWMIFSV